jgi:hypothetical protein
VFEAEFFFPPSKDVVDKWLEQAENTVLVKLDRSAL